MKANLLLKPRLYIAPSMDTIELATELGFASSLEDPSENGELDW